MDITPSLEFIMTPQQSRASIELGPSHGNVSRESRLLLAHLLGEATAALDCDRDLARASLKRATELLEVDAGLGPSRSIDLVKGGLTPRQLNNVLEAIEVRIATKITLPGLAGIAQLSASHFSRAFKTSIGQSPHNFITERRVAKAKLLMVTTAEPLCDIAIACGFSDQAHFSRIFRCAEGTSPNRWRRCRQS